MANLLEEPRRLRADAQRNRERLLETAREAFMRDGIGASLDDIARRSGVGNATLYRHYPTREALIEAVYGNEVAKLGALADELAASRPPLEALRAWMLGFIDHVAEKRIIASAIGSAAYQSAVTVVQKAIGGLVRGAIDSGDLRADVRPFDLLSPLIGVSYMQLGPDWLASAQRLVDILLRGAVR